jgi:ABC-type lipoprotein export system ATPase subunit
VLVTHDLHVASFAERRFVMRDGLIVDVDTSKAAPAEQGAHHA